MKAAPLPPHRRRLHGAWRWRSHLQDDRLRLQSDHGCCVGSSQHQRGWARQARLELTLLAEVLVDCMMSAVVEQCTGRAAQWAIPISPRAVPHHGMTLPLVEMGSDHL